MRGYGAYFQRQSHTWLRQVIRDRPCLSPQVVWQRQHPASRVYIRHSSLASSLRPFLDASRTVTIRAWPPFNTHRGPFHFWHTSVHSHLVTYEVLSHRDSTRVAAQGARVTHPWPPRSAPGAVPSNPRLTSASTSHEVMLCSV